MSSHKKVTSAPTSLVLPAAHSPSTSLQLKTDSFISQHHPEKPSARAVPTKEGTRKWTTSVAVPGSIVLNAQTQELRAWLVGQVSVRREDASLAGARERVCRRGGWCRGPALAAYQRGMRLYTVYLRLLAIPLWATAAPSQSRTLLEYEPRRKLQLSQAPV